MTEAFPILLFLAAVDSFDLLFHRPTDKLSRVKTLEKSVPIPLTYQAKTPLQRYHEPLKRVGTIAMSSSLWTFFSRFVQSPRCYDERDRGWSLLHRRRKCYFTFSWATIWKISRLTTRFELLKAPAIHRRQSRFSRLYAMTRIPIRLGPKSDGDFHNRILRGSVHAATSTPDNPKRCRGDFKPHLDRSKLDWNRRESRR